MLQHLDLLWEDGDPAAALRQRFGWASAEDAADSITTLVNQHYALHGTRIERISISSANVIAWLDTNDGKRIWKANGYPPVHQQVVRTTNTLLWAADHAIPVPHVFPNLAGDHQPIVGKLTFALHSWLDGDHLDPTQPDQLHQMGALLAQLQTLLATFPHREWFPPQPPRWIEHACDTVARFTNRPDLQALGASIKSIDWATLPQGICFNDVRAANLLFKHGSLQAVLDWEELGWNVYVVELAWTMVFGGTLFRNWRVLDAEQQAAVLAGYQAIRMLSSTERSLLFDVIRLLTGDFLGQNDTPYV